MGMKHAIWAIAVAGNCLAAGQRASASGFEVRASVRDDGEQVDSSPTRQVPNPAQGDERNRLNPPRSETTESRPVATVPLGQRVQVAWHARNTGKSQELKDVLVHLFVVKELQLGQAAVPPLTEAVAYESALTMDFEPEEKAVGELDLILRQPGNYLLRIETIGLREQHGHEHYAALDLVVK